MVPIVLVMLIIATATEAVIGVKGTPMQKPMTLRMIVTLVTVTVTVISIVEIMETVIEIRTL